MSTPRLVNSRRKGMAVLELAIFLPVMTGLVVLAIYVGRCGVEQLTLSQTLHYQTWRQRVEAEPGNTTPLCYVDAKQAKLEKSQTGSINSGLIFDKWQNSADTKLQTVSKTQLYGNSWSFKSKWNDEAKWKDAASKHESDSDDDKEKRNQCVYYNLKNNLIYIDNLPYYAKRTHATPIRNDEYVDKR